MADALLETPAKPKVKSGTGFIQVGTDWTANGAKTATACTTPTGQAAALDANCPALKAAWGNHGDTTLVYKATFQAGDLNATGINEAALMNGKGADALCLAYAQVTPAVNVTAADTLQIVWEITILGQ
jgi:hypothetical protein